MPSDPEHLSQYYFDSGQFGSQTIYLPMASRQLEQEVVLWASVNDERFVVSPMHNADPRPSIRMQIRRRASDTQESSQRR